MLPRRKHPAHPLIALLAGLAFLANPAFAQQPSIATDGAGLVTEIAGHRVTFPIPDWMAGSAGTETPFVFNRIEAGVESLVFVPKGESVVSWTRMMGVLAVNRPGYSAESHLTSIIEPLRASCTEGQLGLTPVKARRPGLADALILVCGRYRLSSPAPTGCAAGIVVAVVRESWNGAVKVYEEWCTGAFNLDNPDGWPVRSGELLLLATKMQDIITFEPLAKAP